MPGWRESAWQDLDQNWDLIVIGGGITGAGILREAVRCGLKTLLVEAHDFASGTSSRSSKLVHGGFRYLRNAQLKLTYQAVHERERLLSEGRGLITPLGCLLANYQDDSIPPWVFGAGLVLYDILAWRWGHRRYDREDMQALCPALCEDRLQGGYRFIDAQTDDARLVLRLIQEAVQDGGLALNYAAVIGLLWLGSSTGGTMSFAGSPVKKGQVCGVVLRDQSSPSAGRIKEIFAPVIVNATGAWADELRLMISPGSGDTSPPGITGVPGRISPRLRRLRGSHLIIPGQRLPLSRSINVLHPEDGRPVFAYTWEGVTLVGTTDVDDREQPLTDPQISPREVDYLLKFIQTAFPGQELGRDDIQATFTGIRAVVNTGKADPSRESREHVLWNDAGLVTITGGKLTTFRLMALEALKAVIRLLPEKSRQKALKAHPTRQRILEPVLADESPVMSLPAVIALPAKQRLRLSGRYGKLVADFYQNLRQEELNLIANTPATWAELRWAARVEAVEHLDDLLLRRVRLGLLLPQGGFGLLDQIRVIVQQELKWDDQRWAAEQAAYLQLWQKCYQVGS